MSLTATVMDADGTTRQVPYPPAREPERLDCGHMSTPTQLWPGYAITSDDRHICKECAADIDRASAKAGEPVFAYVHKGEHTRRIEIITWAGVVLGTGYLSEASWSIGGRVQYATVTIDGVRMHGRHYPNAGDYIRLRPYKHQS